MVVDHNVHVHTYLSSCCSDDQSTHENLIARAAGTGIKTIGFADHVWDRAVPDPSDWYRPQDAERVFQARDRLSAGHPDVRVLFGCESEYCGGGKVGISPETAEKFDYVLIPNSHLHISGFVAPRMDRSEDVGRLMLDRFNEIIPLGLATGIAHPFMPLSYSEQTDEILAGISDAEFLDCFGAAAEAGTSIEVHPAMFPSITDSQTEGRHDDAFIRVLSLAKQAGCFFHFCSDSHKLVQFDMVLRLEPFAGQLGLTQEDILPLFRSCH